MAEKKTNFKVRGMLDGKHEVETEDGKIAFLDDKELAELRRDSSELATNDKWPNRPDAPAIAGPFPDAGGSMVPVLLEFASLKAQVVQLLNDIKALGASVGTLTEEKAALEERIVALENASDTAEAAKKVK